jgi:hypothetical protein
MNATFRQEDSGRTVCKYLGETFGRGRKSDPASEILFSFVVFFRFCITVKIESWEILLCDLQSTKPFKLRLQLFSVCNFLPRSEVAWASKCSAGGGGGTLSPCLALVL